MDPIRSGRLADRLVLAALVGWTAWVVLRLLLPGRLDGTAVGLVPRLLLLLLPAAWFLARTEGRQALRAIGLTRNVWAGLAWGIAATLVVPGLALGAKAIGGGLQPKAPPGWLALLNVAAFTPLVEELMFRGVAFRTWRRTMGAPRAALASGLAFAALHLPWYALSGTLTPAQAAASTASIFLYGFGYAVLMWGADSIWAPLTAHALNNGILSFVAT